MFTALYRIIASATVAASLMLAAPAHAAVPSPFTCHYTFIAWQTGFTADLRITNNGPTIDGWTAHWTFKEPTQNLHVWSARMVQPTPHEAVATPESWTSKISTGTWVTFGWTALATSTEVPTDITINGMPC